MRNIRFASLNVYKPWAFVCAIAALMIPLVIVGCGGDSSNNGGYEVTGTLVSTAALKSTGAPSSLPVDGATIAVIGTSDSGVTDSNGNFAFSTSATGSSMQLLVQAAPHTASFAVENIAPNTAELVLSLELQPDTESVSATSLASMDKSGAALAAPTAGTVDTGAPSDSESGPQPTTPGGPSTQPTNTPTGGGSGGGGGAAAGQKVFKSKCAACHSKGDLKGKSASQLKSWPGMPSLSAKDAAALAAYVK